MTATFPNGIASFTQKQDNVDVNYAADINRLQEEIIAIEQSLGTLLNTVNDLSNEVTQIEGDIDNLSEEEQQNEAQDALFENQTTVKFKNLGDRLNYLQNGYHIRAAAISGSNYLINPINNAPKFQSTMPTPLRLAKPSVSQDPYGMYNGWGFTLNKSGFWLMQGSVRFDVGDTRPKGGGGNDDNANWSKKNAGAYQAALEFGGNWTTGMDRKSIVDDSGWWPNMFLNPIVMGWFAAGTKFTLRASQSSAIKQRVSTARMAAVWFRSPGQFNVSP